MRVSPAQLGLLQPFAVPHGDDLFWNMVPSHRCSCCEAVNGDASGTDENVCTHTQFDHEPWWEVDLGAVRHTFRVVILCPHSASLTSAQGVGNVQGRGVQSRITAWNST